MNFLQLAKRVRQECGISGDGPASTEGQSGIYAKIVDWVRAAHDELQLFHNDWNFDWAVADLELLEGVDAYSPLGLWSLQVRQLAKDGMYVYRADQGDRLKHWLAEVPWEEFRCLQVGGVQGMPVYVAMSPDKRLHLYPTPATGLRLKLEYFQAPLDLVAVGDEPRLPAQYHMAIVWRAVMLWCAHDENPSLFQVASANYRELIRKAQMTELPGMRSPEALA